MTKIGLIITTVIIHRSEKHWREVCLEADGDMFRLYHTEYIEHICTIHTDAFIDSLDIDFECHLTCSDLSISSVELYISGCRLEEHLGIEVVFTRYQTDLFEALSELSSLDHSLGIVSAWEEIVVVREVSIEKSRIQLDILEDD